MEFSAAQQQCLLDAARLAIRSALGALADKPTETADPVLLQPAGCFVSLHRRHDHRLRGCIGHMEADRPLIENVRRMGKAVLEDPRFLTHPVSLEELAQLEVEITVLSPLRPAAHPLDFDPRTHGIYLTIGERRGCFLPQVARESGWSAEQLLGRLSSEKMGLDKEAWRSPKARLERFEVAIIGPESIEGSAPMPPQTGPDQIGSG